MEPVNIEDVEINLSSYQLSTTIQYSLRHKDFEDLHITCFELRWYACKQDTVWQMLLLVTWYTYCALLLKYRFNQFS